MRTLAVLLVLGGCSRTPLPGELPDLPGSAADLRRGGAPDLAPTSGSPEDLRSPRPDDVVVVMTSQPRGFYTSLNNTAALGFESGPAPAALGLGGVRLRSGAGNGADQGGKAQLQTSLLSGTPLRDLSALAYATYVLPGSTAAAHLAPALNLQLDLDQDGARDTTMVFEPVYVPEQAAVRGGAWQRWDVRGGRFWFSVATSAFCAANCFVTLQQVLQAHPAATVVDWATQPGLSLTVGQRSGGIWAGFDGVVDAIEIGVRGRTLRYDLEPEAAACERDGWRQSQRPVFAGPGDCAAYHQ